MTDVRQATLAEIIGVTGDGRWPHDGRRIPILDAEGRWRCPACDQIVNDLDPTPCPVDWRDKRPGVDDMLAWLQAQGVSLSEALTTAVRSLA